MEVYLATQGQVEGHDGIRPRRVLQNALLIDRPCTRNQAIDA